MKCEMKDETKQSGKKIKIKEEKEEKEEKEKEEKEEKKK